MRRTTRILGAAVVLLALGGAVAATTTEPAVPVPATDSLSTGATSTAAPVESGLAPTSLALSLSATTSPWGKPIIARGALSPVPTMPGEQVVLELDPGSGIWAIVGQGPLDEHGAFAVEFDALTAGSIRARALQSGIVSVPVVLAVTPVVHASAGKGVAFRNGKLKIKVNPASYNGRVTAVVRQNGKRVARLAGLVRGGRLTLTVPTPGIGAFWVELTFPAAAGLSERMLGAKVVAHGRSLSIGSGGPDVTGLRARLAELHFYVPGPTTSFSAELYDSVVAFQKAYGLERTGSVDAATWRKLGSAKPLRPRYRQPGQHIEIDKTRQILIVVEKGKIVRVLPTSTGATGNTPEGRHQIRWKAPATTTWLGSGILYRTMTFVGNSFAIHGWYSVPAYPASHGCVRIPIWMADWLYNRSPVGETVYVYR
jgi:L,D-transpeptidase catalytic domain/Putative peptidoglycan binding domain